MAAAAGASGGLALSPLATGRSMPSITVAIAVTIAVGVLASLPSSQRFRGGALLTMVALVGAGLGLLGGAARLRAIDAGAYTGASGERVAVTAHVAAVPRRADGEVRVQLDTQAGKLLAEAPEPVLDLSVGAAVRVSGTLSAPSPWLRRTLRRQGIAMVLRGARVVPTGGRRRGLGGRLDAIRERAEEALGEGMPSREAALARGFVLGQDDRIDARTVDQFRRSGLSHLLAVSGQNIVLLTLLALPVLAAFGLSLTARLLVVLALIAVYVPLAGAGPSIQRAGVMGAAGVIATLAGRPGSRAFALLVAAGVTLAINPRASADAGWQLSFAAVVGIFCLTGPIRAALQARLGSGALSRAAAEGAAVTVAATVATGPLIAHHFETLPAGTVFANLLAMPAVAPAMWLGMVSAAAGQVPGLPLEPVNWCNALLLAYIAQVAQWFSAPGWAVFAVHLPGPAEVAAAYVGIALVALGLLRLEVGRRRRRPAGRGGFAPPALAAAAVALLALVVLPESGEPDQTVESGLRVEVLDVGQGDAILLRPADGEPVLVDGGPPGVDLAEKLRDVGAEELAAVVVTHDQSDHSAGILEILGDVSVDRLVYAAAGRPLLAAARSAGASTDRVWQGTELRSGSLRLLVLWPPRAILSTPADPADANPRSLVVLARWSGFSMLLSGDAEAEAAPLDPGPLDVIKVAHHGSEDAGLASLLERSRPRLAVISVGDGNPYGHPTAATLATLAAHEVRILRTDRHGSVTLEVGRGEVRVETGA